MIEILRGLYILVYIYDILVIQQESESISGHLIKVEQVLYTNASDIQLGTALVQDRMPLEFYARNLNGPQHS